jgi:hypothetical protein
LARNSLALLGVDPPFLPQHLQRPHCRYGRSTSSTPTRRRARRRCGGEVAEQTITILENRRVLFGERHVEDHHYCLSSVNEIRHVLTAQINAARTEDLRASLRAMRAACRKFVDAAGPEARNFEPGWPSSNAFGLALGDLRTLMGVQIARIATSTTWLSRMISPRFSRRTTRTILAGFPDSSLTDCTS